jgi:5-formyltetrahydrofolate cyclo-ligase
MKSVMTLAVLKRDLRRQFIRARQDLAIASWQAKSKQLAQNLGSLPIFEQAQTILSYSSIRQEPDLSSLYTLPRNSLPKTWGLPRCVGQSLSWHLWQAGDRLIPSSYGILEPSAEAPLLKLEAVDLILVPAVACDRQGYRLGYGGGYYDRLLASPAGRKIVAIGIVFDFAYVDQLPIESWDRRLSGVCTEYQWVDFRG